MNKILRKKAKELFELYPDKFSNDFEHNKQVLKEMDIFPTKTPRNIVAGLIVKLAKEEKL